MSDSQTNQGGERTWHVRMGDVSLTVEATDYEHAVSKLEAWCLANGVERKGAEFGVEVPDARS